MVEGTGRAIDGNAVQAFGEIQNAGDRIFRHRQRATDAARGRHRHIAAPEIAAEQIAGACRTLMKPFQPRRPRTQVERKWPAPKDDLCFGEETIAFLAGSRPSGVWPQVARRGESGPSFPVFAVEPTSGINQPDGWIEALDLVAIRCA